MSTYKMSDVFDLPTTPAKFWLAPVQRDNDDRRQQQVKFLVHAINTHDAMQARINELEKALSGVIASPHTKLSEGALLEVRQSDIDAAIKAINSTKAGKASSKAVSNIAQAVSSS